jgi:signal transduction histidine kinase
MQAHSLSSPAARSSNTPLQQIADHAGLAHDAGNLLGALHLYSGLLRSPGVLRPEHSHYATELDLISARSSALIQRLLRHYSGMPPVTSTEDHSDQPTDAAEALRRLGPVLQRIAAGTHLTVVAPATLPQLDLPAETLERITVNLVRNAAEAMRSRCAEKARIPARIEVRLAVIAGRAQLTVEDNGPGMPPAIAAAFLRPAPLPPGALRGLGHHIIHELATASGGVLSIRVRPGRGTVFCIQWPLRELQPPFQDAIHRTPMSSTPQQGETTC